MAKKFNMTIPKLPNVEQIDLNLLENKTTKDDIDKYFSKVELSSMSEYERTRYRNMKKNYELMISLGLPAVIPEFMKGPRSRSRKLQKEKKSDDSDEEWTPDLERRKSCRVQKQATYFNIPFKEKKIKKIKNDSEVKQNKTENHNVPKDKKGKIENKKSEEKQKHDYPLRKLPKTNYMALEVPDDDEYLYCEDCNKEYKGDCPVHGELNIVTDSQIQEQLQGTSEQAIFTLPQGLTVKESGIENAGLGVWAEQDISVRTRFGPYKGKLIEDIDQAHSSGYAWQVYKDGKPSHFVDAYEKSMSNWMRYVNCARTETEQNLAAFQYKGEIYYRSYKHISAGSELLVWYGRQYGQDLNIYRHDKESLANWIQPKIINGEEIYSCKLCEGQAFSSLEYLYKHAKHKHGAGHIFQPIHQLQENYSSLSKVVGYLLKYKRGDLVKLEENLTSTNKSNTNNVGINLDLDPSVCIVCGKKLGSDKRKFLIKGISNMCKSCDKNNYLKHDVCDMLEKHIIENRASKQQTGSQPYKCDVCGKCFNRNGHLQTHYRTHTGSQPYKCDVCGKCFSQNGHLQTHYRTHTGSQPYKCDVCGKCFSVSSSLQTHYRTHTGSQPYKCDVCGKCFNHNSNLQKHYRTHTGSQPYKCDVCGKCFSQNGHLQTHYRTHTGSQPYKCDVCGKCFSVSSSLQTHYRTHTGSQPYKCDVCGKCFNDNSNFQKHYRTHTGSKPYKCDVCGKCFSQNGHLQTHYRTHTGSQPYKCDVCGKCFSQNGHLQKHYRTHTGSQPYKCDICGKCFSVSSSLQTHYRTHTGSQPYKCDVCGKCFSQSCHLQTHYRTHTGSQPYKCDICGKCFNQSNNLQTHYRIHTGSQPYKCDVCGKCFNDNSNLQKHYRTHTGSQPYKCDVCGKCFNDNSNLQKHYRTHT